MKKIWILLGIILLITIILTVIVFIGGFGSFAKLLGQQSQEISLDEKSKFIDRWVLEGDDNVKLIFNSDGSYIFGDNQGSYQIEFGKLLLQNNYYGSIDEYTYYFSENLIILTLTKDGQTLTYHRDVILGE